MTAPEGSDAFSTEASIISEKRFISTIKEQITLMGQDWSLKDKIKYEEIYENTLARRKDGNSSELKPDGGILYYKNIPVAIFENKFQKTRQNASERLFKYNQILEKLNIPKENFIVNFDGEGFIFDGSCNGKETMSGSTGAVVQNAIASGYTCLINKSDEDLKKCIKDRLLNIKAYYESYDCYII